jgi:hypothetical protein
MFTVQVRIALMTVPAGGPQEEFQVGVWVATLVAPFRSARPTAPPGQPCGYGAPPARSPISPYSCVPDNRHG